MQLMAHHNALHATGIKQLVVGGIILGICSVIIWVWETRHES